MAKLHRYRNGRQEIPAQEDGDWDETHVKIEYDRHAVSEAWVLLPDNTVEHLICYPSGRSAKLARKIQATSLYSPYPSITSPISENSGSPISEKSHKLEKEQHQHDYDGEYEEDDQSQKIMMEKKKKKKKKNAKPHKPQQPTSVLDLADLVKSAIVRIDQTPPMRTSPGVMPKAEYTSEDRMSWIGTYDLPRGGFLRRTSIVLDAALPPCYTASELKVVDCRVDRKGKAMVRFFYMQSGEEGGFWERVGRKVLCS